VPKSADFYCPPPAYDATGQPKTLFNYPTIIIESLSRWKEGERRVPNLEVQEETNRERAL
jgi:hypothetical protein